MKATVVEFNICGGGPMSLVKDIVSHSTADLKYDIISLNGFDFASDEDFFKNIGVNHFNIHSDSSKIKKRADQCRSLVSLIKENHYDCIHIHHDAASMLFLYGLTAKNAGVEKIVFHSHSTSVIGNKKKVRIILHKVCRPFLKYIGTDFLACSAKAAEWMYKGIPKNKIRIIKNGIDLDKFRIDNGKRAEYREKLGFAEDDKVIGHVGRFSDEKNHRFIIELFTELLEKNNNYRLLLVGDGDLRPEIENYAKEKGVYDKVIFTGNVSNVYDWMQAMDLFVFPSKFEGLGMVAIEAQACGLPVIASTGVPEEVKLTENVKFISTGNMAGWIKSAEEMALLPKCGNTGAVRSAGYDIKQTAEEIEKIYFQK